MADQANRRTLHVTRTMTGTALTMPRHDVWQPPTDVYETDTEIIIKVDIAGVEEDAMAVTLEEGILRVHGVRSDCSAFSKSAVHRMEILCGEFETHVHLPHAVDPSAEVQCTYRNGMLTVVLPKQAARKVPIKVE